MPGSWPIEYEGQVLAQHLRGPPRCRDRAAPPAKAVRGDQTLVQVDHQLAAARHHRRRADAVQPDSVFRSDSEMAWRPVSISRRSISSSEPPISSLTSATVRPFSQTGPRTGGRPRRHRWRYQEFHGSPIGVRPAILTSIPRPGFRTTPVPTHIIGAMARPFADTAPAPTRSPRSRRCWPVTLAFSDPRRRAAGGLIGYAFADLRRLQRPAVGLVTFLERSSGPVGSPWSRY